MSLALAAIVAAGIALPHVLRLERAAPVTAAGLWLSSLGLRAVAGVLGVVYLLFFLPRTNVFEALTHWCLHVALPLISDELAIEGHGVGDAVLYLPGVVLAVSLVALCLSAARGARAARRLVESAALGDGPRDTVIVGGPEVAFAVAGIARPRIVVSAGALARLDDDELQAALDHEQAHILRRHRYVMLLALGLRAIGRLVPGSGQAIHELAFQLERDADRCALRRSDDRLALASAICKAAGVDVPNPQPATARLVGGGVGERLRELLDEPPPHRPTPALNALAAAMVACTLLVSALVPAAAVAGAGTDAHGTHHAQHCGAHG
jgi:hypothetical protein